MFTSNVWMSFPHIDRVQEIGRDDMPFFYEASKRLDSLGLLDDIGICLLHHHFPVSADEALVERFDISSRSIVISPENENGLEDVIPTFWAMQGRNLVPFQFAERTEYQISQVPSEQASIELCQLLTEMKKESRFGFCAIKLPFGITDDEYLVEGPGATDRQLRLSVEERGGALQRSYQTTWKLAKPDVMRDLIARDDYCETICRSGCSRWCLRSSDGETHAKMHDSTHEGA